MVYRGENRMKILEQMEKDYYVELKKIEEEIHSPFPRIIKLTKKEYALYKWHKGKSE
jgi:hypothetical protein